MSSFQLRLIVFNFPSLPENIIFEGSESAAQDDMAASTMLEQTSPESDIDEHTAPDSDTDEQTAPISDVDEQASPVSDADKHTASDNYTDESVKQITQTKKLKPSPLTSKVNTAGEQNAAPCVTGDQSVAVSTLGEQPAVYSSTGEHTAGEQTAALGAVLMLLPEGDSSSLRMIGAMPTNQSAVPLANIKVEPEEQDSGCGAQTSQRRTSSRKRKATARAKPVPKEVSDRYAGNLFFSLLMFEMLN